MSDSLERLAEQYGIGASYYDYRGGLHHVYRGSKAALLGAMGVDVSAGHAIDGAAEAFDAVSWIRMLPQACVVSAEAQRGPPMLPISIPLDIGAAQIDWEITLESGESVDSIAQIDELPVIQRGEAGGRAFVRVNLPLPTDLPLGYHRIAIWLDAGLAGETRLIVTPDRCYEPPAIVAGARS